jgi:polyisoprenoid-binding protein YceI
MNMRSAVFATLLPILLLALAAPLPAADIYQIDPSHTSVIFSASHWRFSYTYGMFQEATGSYIIDKEIPANSRFLFKIAATSLFTNNVKRERAHCNLPRHVRGSRGGAPGVSPLVTAHRDAPWTRVQPSPCRPGIHTHIMGIVRDE